MIRKRTINEGEAMYTETMDDQMRQQPGNNRGLTKEGRGQRRGSWTLRSRHGFVEAKRVYKTVRSSVKDKSKRVRRK